MYQKILIINLMYIGDLLFTTPFIHAVHSRFPNAHIAMLADEKNAVVLKHNPYLSELIAIDKKGYHNKLPNYLRLIKDIRNQKYDLVMNLHANERASAIAAFSGAKIVAGFSAKGLGLFFDKRVRERTDIHQADAYLEVLRAIGDTNPIHQGLEMWGDETTHAHAEIMWQQVFTASGREGYRVIGLNTGGSWPTKRWTKEGFAALADKLLREGFGVAFFGGPMDKKDVDSIVSRMEEKGNHRLAVFTGKTTLLEMAALVKKCTLLVTGDSGPMHIAVSQQVPVIALFGPSNPVRYAPYQQADAVLHAAQECMFCGKHMCEHHSCMKEINAEKVYAMLQIKIQ